MRDKWHVLELVVAILLTAIACGWIIAYAALWIMQGRLPLSGAAERHARMEAMQTAAREQRGEKSVLLRTAWPQADAKVAAGVRIQSSPLLEWAAETRALWLRNAIVCFRLV